MKNYICFVNDHSGSMRFLTEAAIRDYNSIIESVKNAATREMQDTIVNTVGFGFGHPSIMRQVINSNPHVLNPVISWPTVGQTPLYDAIGDAIDLLKSVPDHENSKVSFLVSITTDGGENDSTKYNRSSIRSIIEQHQASGRWTFVIRVPFGNKKTVANIGIPEGNIQEWETTSEGMQKATISTQAAVNNYFSARSAGKTSSTVFYADASQVDTSKLVPITKEVSMYLVPRNEMGIEIQKFILKHRMQYLKGAAFYQLTKTEARVQPDKMVLVRDRATGEIYAGKDARKMIGLPDNSNARLHPGDHKNYDIFIQSSSVNRKLVAGSAVVYWEKVGVPFTEDDLAYLKPKQQAVEPIKVEPTNKPTKSPIPVQKKAKDGGYEQNVKIKAKPIDVPSVNGQLVKFFETRKLAREYSNVYNKSGAKDTTTYHQDDIEGNENNYRWFVYI